jgi:hypothetical protein
MWPDDERTVIRADPMVVRLWSVWHWDQRVVIARTIWFEVES